MKIVFVSNYYNHHQHALCRELERMNPGQFHFIATSEMRQDRKTLGYGNWDIPDFVRTAHTGVADRLASRKLIDEADVVIAGATPERLIADRIWAGKLTFRYTERLFKQPPSALEYLKKRVVQKLRNPSRKPVYLLCAGAYTKADFTRLGVFRNRGYRWGYFPETKHYGADELRCGKNPASLLWVGRFLDWKHPDDALRAVARLRDAGYEFRLRLIGTGPLEQQLRAMVSTLKLEQYVSFLGTMKPEQVRCHMEHAGIFLFTSDRQEGWGAVLNEALNSGCAVVSSCDAGSVPYLIEDEKNGLIYRSGDVDMLYEKIKTLLDSPEKQAALGINAYHAITELWNAQTAAKRLCALAEQILAGEKTPDLYQTGPCAKA